MQSTSLRSHSVDISGFSGLPLLLLLFFDCCCGACITAIYWNSWVIAPWATTWHWNIWIIHFITYNTTLIFSFSHFIWCLCSNHGKMHLHVYSSLWFSVKIVFTSVSDRQEASGSVYLHCQKVTTPLVVSLLLAPYKNIKHQTYTIQVSVNIQQFAYVLPMNMS